MIDEDSLAGGVNTCFQEQSRQGVTQSTGYNTGFLANDNTFFSQGRKWGEWCPPNAPVDWALLSLWSFKKFTNLLVFNIC